MAETGVEALKSEVAKVVRSQEEMKAEILQRIEANTQKLERKLESTFEALAEMIRSRNRNTTTMSPTDSDKRTAEPGSRSSKQRQEAPRTPNTQGGSGSGFAVGFEARNDYNQMGKIDSSMDLEDGVSSNERNQPRIPQEDDRDHLTEDSQAARDNDCTLKIEGSLEPAHETEFEAFPETSISSPQAGGDGNEEERPDQHICFKVNAQSSKAMDDHGAFKELTELVNLLIELIEIRIANSKKISRTDFGLNPIDCFLSAHNLFVEMSTREVGLVTWFAVSDRGLNPSGCRPLDVGCGVGQEHGTRTRPYDRGKETIVVNCPWLVTGDSDDRLVRKVRIIFDPGGLGRAIVSKRNRCGVEWRSGLYGTFDCNRIFDPGGEEVVLIVIGYRGYKLMEKLEWCAIQDQHNFLIASKSSSSNGVNYNGCNKTL